MRTRHEQVQAHRFVTRRIVSALLSGEPESTELPMRRLALALFGSGLVAAIVFAVVGVIGFINPAGGRPAEGDLIIMRETGTRYVVVGRTLHPVLNWTSALLFAGNGNPKTRQMSRKSVAAFGIGAAIGIPGAPDPPPPRKSLLRLPWSVCSASAAGSTTLTTQVVIGHVPAGASTATQEALLLGTEDRPDAARYLLFDNRRYRIPDRVSLTALELAAVTPIRIGVPLLNSITAGPDLVAPKITDAGRASSQVIGGATGRIGQVYRSGTQFYVLTTAGLTSIGQVAAQLLGAKDVQVPEISAQEAASRQVTANVEPRDFPARLPPLARIQAQTSMVCAVLDNPGAGGAGATIKVLAYGPDGEQLAGGAARVDSGGVQMADRIVVPTGRGALVRVQPAPGVTADTTVHLVSDQGIKYPLRNADGVQTATALGYAGYDPLPVPAPVLALVPTGPTLDPRAARQFIVPPAAGPAPVTPASTPPPTTAPPTTGASTNPSGSTPPGAGPASPRTSNS